MERIRITLRLALTLFLLCTLVELSHTVGARVALKTAPPAQSTPSLVVQARRTVMDRIAEGRMVISSDPNRAESILTQVFRDARDPELRERASTLLVQMAETSWPADHRRDFLGTIAPSALESGRAHQIPPSIILAQAALESGWGRSRLAQRHHNIFGVKATGKQSAASFNTLEFGPKGAHIVRAKFRTFPSTKASIQHHGHLLTTDKRYEASLDAGDNWRSFLAALAPTYASDPSYAAHIAQIIETYGLDRWDAVCGMSGRTTRS
jgi:flagellum-specific peptidoglycan hydrolase FlgJ